MPQEREINPDHFTELAKLDDLLWEVIDCWRESIEGKEDDWTYMRCDACSDEKKQMCELFQRFDFAVTRHRGFKSKEEIVKYKAFIEDFKTLTDYYWK